MFLQEFCYVHQSCIYLMKKTVILWNRMISEWSCDTEDWSNDAENTALITAINYILQYIQTENSYFKSAIIFHNITVFF